MKCVRRLLGKKILSMMSTGFYCPGFVFIGNILILLKYFVPSELQKHSGVRPMSIFTVLICPQRNVCHHLVILYCTDQTSGQQLHHPRKIVKI